MTAARLRAATATAAQTHDYAVVPGFRPLQLDLHRPPGTAAVPLVVFVHGGGWVSGRRSVFGPMYAGWQPSPFAEIVAAGVAVASVDYRLSGEARFPAQLDDVTAALHWLHGHAAALGLDAGRVALWGESAGGHLAALAGLTRPGVAAVVDWYGPTDLTTFAADAAAHLAGHGDPAGSRESLLLGADAVAVPELARAASPVHRVHRDAPPFLLLHGTADGRVPVAQSRRLAAALESAGVAARLQLLDGADHLWLDDPSTARSAFDTSLAFVLDHIG